MYLSTEQILLGIFKMSITQVPLPETKLQGKPIPQRGVKTTKINLITTSQ